jgi:diphthine-ammonia ligase
MKTAVALFSGGKDSTLSIIRAIEQGYSIKKLLFIIPTFPYPNPHLENYSLVERIAGATGLELRRIPLRKGVEQETLAEAVREEDVDALVAGDVLLEEHVQWHRRVCEFSGVELVEPLFGEDTGSLYWETVNRGIEFTIIAVTPRLPEWLIGVRVSEENAGYIYNVVRRHGADPIGEFGEYHTLVNKAPLMRISGLNYRLDYTVRRGEYGFYGVFRLAA